VSKRDDPPQMNTPQSSLWSVDDVVCNNGGNCTHCTDRKL